MDIITEINDKTCYLCKKKKKITDFCRDKHRKDGLCSECRECHSSRNKKHYKYPIKQERRRRDTLKKFRITEDQYEQALISQCNVCAICGNPETARSPKGNGLRRLAIDHCHQTGMFRGLLCRSCNLGLGNFSDDPEKLQKAIDYLCRQNITIEDLRS